jgi:hypothetical protein
MQTFFVMRGVTVKVSQSQGRPCPGATMSNVG